MATTQIATVGALYPAAALGAEGVAEATAELAEVGLGAAVEGTTEVMAGEETTLEAEAIGEEIAEETPVTKD